MGTMMQLLADTMREADSGDAGLSQVPAQGPGHDKEKDKKEKDKEKGGLDDEDLAFGVQLADSTSSVILNFELLQIIVFAVPAAYLSVPCLFVYLSVCLSVRLSRLLFPHHAPPPCSASTDCRRWTRKRRARVS